LQRGTEIVHHFCASPHAGEQKTPVRGIDTKKKIAATISDQRKWRSIMKVSVFVSILVVLTAGLFSSSSNADDTLARFKGGIGVIPVSSGVGADPTADVVNRNIVRGIQPAGQLWRIRDLDARIRTNGDIKVDGKGLVLAGGNTAGRATGQSVFATLICEAPAPFTERNTNTAGVQLAADGDFRIDDVLTPLPPADCASPMLLIRTAGSGNWFAVGILVTGKNND
jgi:hypothetical protein